MRAVGIIIKNKKILLIHRIKDGKEYYVFPGGAIVQDESPKEAVTREIREELSINNIVIDRFLFQITNQGNKEFYYLIKDFSGQPELGGEEKQRMNQDNQYYPVWMDLDKIQILDNLYPELARKKIVKLYKDNN
jgi:ADP-ribose pyrophosphatase YjhB (NUDIX family)